MYFLSVCGGLEAQIDGGPVSVQLLYWLQQKVTNKHTMTLKQQGITSFLCLLIWILV